MGRCEEALRAAWASWIAELGGAGAAMRDHARERGLVGIGIKAHAAVGDAAVALHVRGLDHHQRRAGIGQHAEMAEMPVVGAAVVGTVLAHGGDDDAVGKFRSASRIGVNRALMIV